MTSTRNETGESRLEKESWRRRIRDGAAADGAEGGGLPWGKAAAVIRKTPFYRDARHVLVPPAVCFFQVRLNALMDRKRLTVPTPGIQRGFQHFDPHRTTPADFVDFARLRKAGAPLTKAHYGSPLEPPIDLVVGEALCAGEDGGIVGDGRGHLDLTCAVLQALGWLDVQAAVLAAALQSPILPFCPQEDHDVKAHGVITRDGFHRTGTESPIETRIYWEKLDARWIRRNEVLFFLASREGRALR